jgi:hypothetical protein
MAHVVEYQAKSDNEVIGENIIVSDKPNQKDVSAPVGWFEPLYFSIGGRGSRKRIRLVRSDYDPGWQFFTGPLSGIDRIRQVPFGIAFNDHKIIGQLDQESRRAAIIHELAYDLPKLCIYHRPIIDAPFQAGFFNFHENVRPLQLSERLFSNFSGLLGRDRRPNSGGASVLHLRNGLAQSVSLPEQSTKLQERSRDQSGGQTNIDDVRPPIIRRLLLYAGGFLGGFVVALSGVEQLNGERRFLGAALIAGGCLGAIGGSALWLATLCCESTWGWWWM